MSRQSRRDFLKNAAVSAATLVSGQALASEAEFGLKPLANSETLAQNGYAEGQCGEGRCGGAMSMPDKPESNSGYAEGKCGEGKCGEGRCGASMQKSNPQPSEGKCGEGRCGGNM